MFGDHFILPTNYIPTVREFLEALEIRPNGLGAQLFTEVYEEFFCQSTDLRGQYEKYYCVEYKTLRKYLEFAHEVYLDPDQLEKMHILEIESPGGVVDEMYDDNVLDKVLDCLKRLEALHEN